MNPRSFSLALLALFLLPETLHATPVFLENVSESGGWYDCNKKTKWKWGSGSMTDRPSGLQPGQSRRQPALLGSGGLQRSSMVAEYQKRPLTYDPQRKILHLRQHAGSLPAAHLPNPGDELD